LGAIAEFRIDLRRFCLAASVKSGLPRLPCARDVVSETFDPSDEALGPAFGVASGEVVGIEVAVGLAGREMCQIALSNE